VILLKIPTRVGNERAPIRVRKGGKWLGNLSGRPKVNGGKLFAGKNILISRDHQLVQDNPGGPGMSAHFFNNGTTLEVRYGVTLATYKLYEDRIVYSDGPPHPDHLQLAVRTSTSGGVEEPEGS
jgi:hypothetical protein